MSCFPLSSFISIYSVANNGGKLGLKLSKARSKNDHLFRAGTGNDPLFRRNSTVDSFGVDDHCQLRLTLSIPGSLVNFVSSAGLLQSRCREAPCKVDLFPTCKEVSGLLLLSSSAQSILAEMVFIMKFRPPTRFRVIRY